MLLIQLVTLPLFKLNDNNVGSTTKDVTNAD